MDLSVIIPNYNGETLLPRFLPSVVKAVQEYGKVSEIIVVDDASMDSSCTILERDFPNIHLITRPTNGGFSRTCNTGLARASGRICCFLNTDVWLEPDFFQYFESHFQKTSTFAVTPLGFDFTTRKPIDGAKIGEWRRGNLRVTRNEYYDKRKSRDSETALASFSVQGSYFLVRTEMMRTLGGFDELFSPFIFEETDLSYRALKRGWTIHFEPKMKAFHQVSSTITKQRKPFALQVISERNRLLFTWKNFQSLPLLTSHFVFLGLKLLSFKLSTWCAFLGALRRIDQVRALRRIERAASRMTDIEVLSKTASAMAL